MFRLGKQEKVQKEKHSYQDNVFYLSVTFLSVEFKACFELQLKLISLFPHANNCQIPV